jgi:hypothetical protein
VRIPDENLADLQKSVTDKVVELMFTGRDF